MRDADAKIVGAYSTALREYAEVLSKDDTVIDTLNAAADALDAALARLVAAAERIAALEREVELANFDGHWDAKVAAEAERDAALANYAAWKNAHDQLLGHATRHAEQLEVALARVEQLETALRGLLEDDDLPYPPDGDECFCSMCKAVRVARAALGDPDAPQHALSPDKEKVASDA